MLTEGVAYCGGGGGAVRTPTMPSLGKWWKPLDTTPFSCNLSREKSLLYRTRNGSLVFFDNVGSNTYRSRGPHRIDLTWQLLSRDEFVPLYSTGS